MLEHMDTYKGKLADVDREKPEFEYIETDPTGRYGRFKDVLGRGAMKTVYKAFDQVRGMEVAWNQVKLNDVFRSPDELQRLYSEVHLLSTLDHESIIKFFTSWIDVKRRNFNFITEMLTSGTLREYRQKYKKVDIRAVKNWARQILGGLVYLHGHEPPVIHRDLKCDNIFVNGHLGQVKIGDLGFAAVLQGSQAHSVIGTPEFMAPELYDEDYNELVDIYSFGMCVLEMLTSEYPYNECSNPAQIYKKVTSGKLPENFYKIEDPEARKFVGKCLQTASKRLPAKELLLDPFLASEDEVLLSLSSPKSRSSESKAIANDIGLLNLGKLVRSPSTSMSSPTKRRTDMTITGNMNAEDDTIYLKVQIADKHGTVSNIYFPFDIITDTPIDVATEMVKELDINDRDPLEIAEVIDKEISALVPHWKTNNEWEVPPLQNHPADLHHHQHQHQHQHHTYSYQDIDDDENDVGGNHHPFYSFSSSCSSSQASLSGLLPQSPSGTQFMRGDDLSYGLDWLQDVTLGTTDDETSSQTSQHSFKYSNMNYHSATELPQDCDQMMISPTTRQSQAQPQPHVHQHQILKQSPRCTRFCPEEKPSVTGLQTVPKNKCKQIKGDAYPSANDPNPRLTRMRSLVDVRSQLLHKSLVEEVNKRRLSKTVTTVENIGFQSPFDNGKGPSSSGVSGSGKSNPKYNVGKKDGFFKWRRSNT